MSIYLNKVHTSVAHVSHWFGATQAVPEVVVVLGSGLSHAFDEHLINARSLSYTEISGFPKISVLGHAGKLTVGNLYGITSETKQRSVSVAFLQGRVHAYEGYNAAEVVHGLRTLITWGVKKVILTNAAGCLENQWPIGCLMLINDHINQTGLSPLIGEYGLGFGSKFVDMTEVYNKKIQETFITVAKECDIPLFHGIYCGVLGPQYETPAEIRMMKNLGASAVGMSTVLEAIACRQMGAQIAGLSCLTNYGAGLSSALLSHSEVTMVGAQTSPWIAKLIAETCVRLTF